MILLYGLRVGVCLIVVCVIIGVCWPMVVFVVALFGSVFVGLILSIRSFSLVMDWLNDDEWCDGSSPRRE